MNAAWDQYDVTVGTRALMGFVVDDLSNWYVRLNGPASGRPTVIADPAAVATLHELPGHGARLLAPAAPFLSDWLHRALDGSSVHLAGFPVPGGARGTRRWRRRWTRSADWRRWPGRPARRDRIRVRQPLARMQVAVPAAVPRAGVRRAARPAGREVNVKAVEVVESDADLVRLRAKPNFRALGKRYGKADTGRGRGGRAARRRSSSGGWNRAGRRRWRWTGGDLTYLSADVVGEREVASDWLVQSDGPFVAALDPALTPELAQEGLARELVNRIQRLRKDAGYEYLHAGRPGVGDGAGCCDAVHGACGVHPGRDAGAGTSRSGSGPPRRTANRRSRSTAQAVHRQFTARRRPAKRPALTRTDKA